MHTVTPNLKATSLLLICLFIAFPLFAQKSKKGDSDKKPEKTEKVKPISEITKKCKAYEGLFTLYQDTVNGKAYIKIRKDQLTKEFIYFSHIADGVLEAGHFRGAFRDEKIFTIQQYFNKLEFCVENTSFYFDKDNPLSKAAHANINRPIVYSKNIAGINKDKTEFLIEADGLFLSESFGQVKRSPRPGDKSANKRFALGDLSKDKNKYVAIKNYPQNTDVLVDLVYEKKYPSNYGHNAVTDPRYVSVKVQHSLIEVPENDYQPRHDDARVGYFMQQINDMTSTSATPYKDVINRWHLVKKDPSAELSEPVEPITWWIENTTPHELRPMIQKGVEAWNIAFEKAGFKNAVVCKVQPDDADWDAGDIRYNVLRWTSSPIPPFGGYGPSFVNPRTGQILGADIMLEFVYITARLRQEKLFETAGTHFEEMANELETQPEFDDHVCSYGHFAHQSLLFGLNVMEAEGLTDLDKKEYIKQSVYRLVLHEVGHTLGLNHNFKASQLHSFEDVFNKELTMKEGLTGSVMEYPAPNIASDPAKRGHYYDIIPGPYDNWAIEFAYSPALEDANAEAKRLDKILSRSTEHALSFGNDADDMRSSGKGLDPRIMVGDMSSDGITYSVDRIKLVNNTFPKIKEKYAKDGESYHELRNAYLTLTATYGGALRSVTRYIGGVYIDRALAGQAGETQPFTPVPLQTQKEAMQVLHQYGFGTQAFAAPSDVYNYLQMQRRGFNHFGSNEDPKIHDRILAFQKNLLGHLLHPTLLKRITDTQLYGNQYSLSEVLTDLTNAIIKDDLRTAVSPMRQNLQLEYVHRLINIIQPNGSGKDSAKSYDHIAQSAALYQLNQINSAMRSANTTDIDTKAHRQHIVFKINKALEAK